MYSTRRTRHRSRRAACSASTIQTRTSCSRSRSPATSSNLSRESGKSACAGASADNQILRVSKTALPDDYLAEGDMKYLCLIYDEEKTLGAMSKSDSDAFMGEYFAFTEGIRKSGHYVAGEALQPVNTATTVRIRGGKLSTTDGPFAET